MLEENWEIGTHRAKYACVVILAPDNTEERTRWLLQANKDSFEALSIGTEKRQVCIVPLDESNTETARLIVVAPKMLRALIHVKDMLEYNATIEEIHGLTNGHREFLQEVNNIISQATGETNGN